jgi:hypothetical protein
LIGGLICFNYYRKLQNEKQGRQPKDGAAVNRTSESQESQPDGDQDTAALIKAGDNNAILSKALGDIMTSSGVPKLSAQAYINNLQFLQNFMGLYCDIYDQVMLLMSKLDWSKPEVTKTSLRYVVGSIPLVILGYYFVPLNLLVLVAGLIIFVCQTPLWHHLTFTIPMLALYKASVLATSFIRAIPIPDSIVNLSTDTSDESKEGIRETILPDLLVVEVYENQRWWAGKASYSTFCVGFNDSYQ